MDILSHPAVLIGLFIASLVIGAIWKLRTAKPQTNEDPSTQHGVQINSLVLPLLLAGLVLFQLPSLSIDINGIFTYAFDVVNAFMPLIAIIAGLGLGFNLITKISSLFTRAL